MILVFLCVCLLPFEESVIISYTSMSSSFRLAIEFMLFFKVSLLMSILSSLNSSLSKNPSFGLVITIASRLELVSPASSSSSSSLAASHVFDWSSFNVCHPKMTIKTMGGRNVTSDLSRINGPASSFDRCFFSWLSLF